jgi:hypothetical protein
MVLVEPFHNFKNEGFIMKNVLLFTIGLVLVSAQASAADGNVILSCDSGFEGNKTTQVALERTIVGVNFKDTLSVYDRVLRTGKMTLLAKGVVSLAVSSATYIYSGDAISLTLDLMTEQMGESGNSGAYEVYYTGVVSYAGATKTVFCTSFEHM